MTALDQSQVVWSSAPFSPFLFSGGQDRKIRKWRLENRPGQSPTSDKNQCRRIAQTALSGHKSVRGVFTLRNPLESSRSTLGRVRESPRPVRGGLAELGDQVSARVRKSAADWLRTGWQTPLSRKIGKIPGKIPETGQCSAHKSGT